MKKAILVLLFAMLCPVAMAKAVAIYAENDPDVPFRVTKFVGSASTSRFSGRADVMVCHDACVIEARALRDAGVPQRHWKVNIGTNSVLEMSPAEKLLIDADRIQAELDRQQCQALLVALANRQNLVWSSMDNTQKNQPMQDLTQYIVCSAGGTI